MSVDATFLISIRGSAPGIHALDGAGANVAGGEQAGQAGLE
jgi:hypothetical protein